MSYANIIISSIKHSITAKGEEKKRILSQGLNLCYF